MIHKYFSVGTVEWVSSALDCSGDSLKVKCFIPTHETEASARFPFSLSLLQTQSQSKDLLEVKVKVNYQPVVASTIWESVQKHSYNII